MKTPNSPVLTACVTLVAICSVVATADDRGGIGPDVIVGNLHQLYHWGSTGAIHAYSVGTVSCNIGDEPLLWQSWNNQHPVIGQTMYRFKGGRFEQLGQSWLKWAFASLNQNYCGACIDPGTSSLLGVNCSDPYGAQLNGSQSSLGPKSVVNPFTGYFPQSHATPGSGTIAGRLQVRTVDIDPSSNPNALYVVEGQYVAPDDSAAGNLHNNASWRQIWVQGNLDITFNRPGGGQSETVREQPAIMAWQAFDPSVSIIYVDVPEDGRIYIAWTITPALGGTWDYEFAVQNLNSHRSVSGFIVPLPEGTNITSPGFHDVDYHSGEPYDPTDWSPTIAIDGIRWDTIDYNTNPNANALRWGTTYNFRFNADAPPGVLSEVELVLFRPGFPTSLVVPLPVPGVNDDCDNASPILAGVTAFDNTYATTDGPAEPACGFNGTSDADLWYRYTATCDGDATISLCNSGFDTVLAVYAACPAGSGEYLACDNDACSPQSEVTLAVSADTQYLIRVGGYQGATGSGELSIVCVPSGGLVNDDCADAVTVGDGVTPFDTTGATADGPAEPSCGYFNGSTDADIWFRYVASCTGQATVSLCGSSFDTTLAVYGAACPTGPGQAIACNDDACGTQSELTFDAAAGSAYHIRIGGYNGATGTGVLNVTCTDAGELCANDTVETAIVVGGLPFAHTGDTSQCTNDYDEACPYTNSSSKDAVYRYTPVYNQTIEIDLCGSAYDTKVYVYEGVVTPGSPVACNDDGCPGSPPAAYRSFLPAVDLQAGTPYFIVVDGWGGDNGVYDLVIEDVTALTPGDMDCDGDVDFDDIDPFVMALSNPAEYALNYPNCTGLNGDIDGDGDVDFDDIDPFVELLNP